jgi:hypothetical protein
MVDPRRELPELAQRLNTPLRPNWPDSLAQFADGLRNYLEYQVALADGALALVTLGRGEPFLDAIDAYLAQRGVEPAGLDIYRSMRHYAGKATWGLKLALSDEPEVQIYVKKPLPVSELLFWLGRRANLEPGAGKLIADVATLLDKPYTHFFGADFTPGQPIRYQLYFTQYLERIDPVALRVRETMSRLGLPDQVTLAFSHFHHLLAQPDRSLWLSLAVDGGRVLPTLKLDYNSIRLGVAGLVAEEAGPGEARRLQATGDILGVDTADYFGMRYRDAGDPALSLYLTRYSAAWSNYQ